MPQTDLVLEGGGVKATGLIGALAALEERPLPYSFRRIAGTSAGAVVGAFLAAGMNTAEIRQAMEAVDYRKFEDHAGLGGWIPGIGPALGVLFHQGVYAGQFLHDWVKSTLAEHGVHTWADLKQEDPESALPPEQRYRLVVVVSDVSRGLMLRLPWDYQRLLGVDPDQQSVADAIRASASIPFFYRPWHLPLNPEQFGQREIVCIDGGILSNYPIGLFDRTDGKPARWPTIGIKLSARTSLSEAPFATDTSSWGLAKAVLSTMISAHDNEHIDDPEAIRRTIFVDTSGISATDFGMSAQTRESLYQSGLAAGRKFLEQSPTL